MRTFELKDVGVVEVSTQFRSLSEALDELNRRGVDPSRPMKIWIDDTVALYIAPQRVQAWVDL